jgi:cell division protein FtsW (lipid II flippase)
MINHFVIVFGMVMIMYSSESNDDERVKLIRQALLRFFFALLVCSIMLYIILTSLESFKGSFYFILYIIELVLAAYLVSFRISLRTNPSWIFRKPSEIKTRFIVMGASILFLIGWIIFVVVTYKI